MVDFKKLIPTLCLTFSLLLAISSIYSPWWGIWNSKENQAATNNTIIGYYMPLQTIVAGNAKANTSLALPFDSIAENDTNKSALSVLFTSTLALAAAGMVLTGVVLVLSLIAVLRKKVFTFAWIIGIVGTLLLFVSLLYVAANMPATLQKFTNAVPPEIGVAEGKQISSYWGSTGTWIWGAGYGWLSLFVSALLCFIGSLLVRKTLEKVE